VTDLYVSLSGGVVDEAFADALGARGVPLTHLLRPAAAPADLVAWIRQRVTSGDALALHGYDHATRPLGHGRGRRGEFASLPRHEAGLRLTAARRALTAATLWTDVFVPPRWLASDGTVAALADQGFRVLVDESGIRDLPTGAVLPGRVLGFRTGERLLAAEVAWVLRRGGPLRIHVRAKDLRRPGRAEAALAAVDAALPHVTPTTYGRAARRAA
jgi:uncharacterized protein